MCMDGRTEFWLGGLDIGSGSAVQRAAETQFADSDSSPTSLGDARGQRLQGSTSRKGIRISEVASGRVRAGSELLEGTFVRVLTYPKRSPAN
jgi:hypothetical protein